MSEEQAGRQLPPIDHEWTPAAGDARRYALIGTVRGLARPKRATFIVGALALFIALTVVLADWRWLVFAAFAIGVPIAISYWKLRHALAATMNPTVRWASGLDDENLLIQSPVGVTVLPLRSLTAVTERGRVVYLRVPPHPTPLGFPSALFAPGTVDALRAAIAARS
ncbi:hypothetical protein [Tsukamurella soli]|uniref:YcxB-like protein n=1 Tax=Tsukamurella soli TaxID=644556 RepID=A0ABP8JC12_9ACTN